MQYYCLGTNRQTIHCSYTHLIRIYFLGAHKYSKQQTNFRLDCHTATEFCEKS